MDRFRRLGIFLVRVLKNCPPFSPLPPAGEPAQMVLGRNLRSFPKPEMEADTYLGGGGRKLVLGLEARRCQGNLSSGGHTVLRALGWFVSIWVWSPCKQPRLEYGFPFQFPSIPSWCFRTAHWQVGVARNPASDTRGLKPGTSKEKLVFPAEKQTKLLCGPLSLKSRVG